MLHDSIDRKVCILRLTPCKGLKSSTLSHNFVWWLQRYVRERWSESYNSSSSRGTQYDKRHESRRYDERNNRSSQEDQEVGLGQEYQKEVRVGQEDLIHIDQQINPDEECEAITISCKCKCSLSDLCVYDTGENFI